MTRQPGHRVAFLIMGTCAPLCGLAVLPAMVLANAVSGSMSDASQSFFWAVTWGWAAFCLGAPILMWLVWLFSKRAAFWISIANVAVIAAPLILLQLAGLVAALGI
jgi:hypothetical protein